MARQKPEPSTGAMVATTAGLVGLIGFVGWLAIMDASESAANECGDEVDAWSWAKIAVQERLKAPSTAEFPWYDEGFVHRKGECGFLVAGHVDAQNGFGAQIRSRFQVTLEYLPEAETYSVDGVVIQ